MDYLLFPGLLYSHKGINYAIDVAERAGQKLIIAGPLRYSWRAGSAKPFKTCALHAVSHVWEEPFGLVMIEAMACGTPVLAFGNGAVPEVMQGFPELICRDIGEMVQKVQNQAFPAPSLLREYIQMFFPPE